MRPYSVGFLMHSDQPAFCFAVTLSQAAGRCCQGSAGRRDEDEDGIFLVEDGATRDATGDAFTQNALAATLTAEIAVSAELAPPLPAMISGSSVPGKRELLLSLQALRRAIPSGTPSPP